MNDKPLLEERDMYSSCTSLESIEIKEKLILNSSNASNRTVLTYSEKNRTLSIKNETITQASDSLDLHACVFNNDIVKLKSIIESLRRNNKKCLKQLLSAKDKHENTPLHLACMMGNYEITKLLVDAGATVKTRNKQMWTPLNEAISYGNRELIKCTLKKFENEVEAIVDEAKPRIVEALQEMDDFYVEIKWDFESWIPFISRFLPSDTCKLYKKGTKLRLDCTLGDIAAKSGSNSTGNKESAANSMGATISPFKWERGDLSFIFEIEKIGTKNSIIFMDNTKKIFLIIDKTQQVVEEPDLDKEIDLLLSKEMIFLKLNTKNAIFSPTQVGWFTKRDKIEQLNGYNCQFYDVNNLFIVTKLRVEHLSDEELKKREEKQTKLKEQLSVGGGGELKKTSSDSQVNKADAADDVRGLENLKDLDIDEEIEYRPSLPPPPPNKVTWNEYIGAKEGEWPCLGRKPKCKESKKEFKAQIAMSQEFPLTITDLDKLLDALVPLAKFRKLKEFISVKLPPGFPVKIDIPIVPAISAKVCFQNFRKNCEHSQSLFTVPTDYKEEVLLPDATSNEEMKSSF